MYFKSIFVFLLLSSLTFAQNVQLIPVKTWSPQLLPELDWQQPSSVGISAITGIIVTDAHNHQIYALSLDGGLRITRGGYGWGNGSFQEPVATDVSNGLNIYIADHLNNRIQRLDKDLHWIATIEPDDSWDESVQFKWPRDVIVSPLGDIFILDGDRARIIRMTADGEPLFSFGDTDTGILEDPCKMIWIDGGRILVSDPGSGNVVIFTENGDLVAKIGESFLNAPTAMAAWKNRMFFVYDEEEECILLLNLNGRLESRWFSAELFNNVIKGVVDICVYQDTLYLLNETESSLNAFTIISM
ncbi:NHL repeat-containing protein [bacterium]|nr:NHL repeat-containing protein [bacterium]